jgi:glycosyltransferase involved in cell wall biosynthesis
LRVLVAHNRYRSATPSGENDVVDSEIQSLREAGVDVVPYLRSSDEIDALPAVQRLALPLRPFASPQANRDVARLLDEQVDLLHLHNPNPLISLSVVRVAKRRGIPVVQTVHNHRMVCIKGTHFRDGGVCTDCVGKNLPWPGIVHGCYRDSVTQSVPVALSLRAHRSTYQMIDRHIALTPAVAEHLVRAGIAPDRITVKSNSLPDPGAPATSVGRGFAFVGRLSEEKGVQLLLDAWLRHPEGSLGPLDVVGDGPLAQMVREAATRRTDISFHGLLAPPEVHAVIRGTGVVVVPSTCPEVCPRIVLEAFALGRPVLGTDLGGLPALLPREVGWVSPAETRAFSQGLSSAAADLSGRHVRAARERYESHFDPRVVTGQLLDVYDQLIDARARDGRR